MDPHLPAKSNIALNPTQKQHHAARCDGAVAGHKRVPALVPDEQSGFLRVQQIHRARNIHQHEVLHRRMLPRQRAQFAGALAGQQAIEISRITAAIADGQATGWIGAIGPAARPCNDAVNQADKKPAQHEPFKRIENQSSSSHEQQIRPR